MIDEYRKGICGNMPACQMTDVHVKIWNYLEAGQEDKAIRVYNAALPLMNFETGYAVASYKTTLKERGVIRSAAMRQVGGITQLDDLELAELRRILKDLKPEFTV